MTKVKTPLGKVGYTPQGAWVEDRAYARLDAVSLAGSSYISLIDNNTAPPTDTSKWMVSAKKGDKGDPFTWDDFTEEQLAILKGDKGDPFEYEDFTDEQIENLKKPAMDAAAEAEDAAETARNLPKIIDGVWWLYDVAQEKYVQTPFNATGRSPQIDNGTWWTWNDNTQQYEDTHQPVSSNYVLSKGAVEGVLTGDIASHNHAAQLAAALADYVQKVAGKQLSTEDFTTALKNKLDGLANYNDAAVRQSISDINSRIDTLLGGSASSAIDTFHEIEAFLQGITDTKSLAGMMSDLKTEIKALIPTKLSELENDNDTVQDADYVHTDNNFSTAEKTKLAKVHAVPTLDHEPGETDLSFTDAEGAHVFQIGEQARVYDSEKEEFVFFQLHDITGGKAVWKLAGSGGEMELPGETLVITLAANHAGYDNELLGAVIRVAHLGQQLDLTWTGQPLTVEIPYGTDYHVTGSNTAQFAAPPVSSFVAGVGYTRQLTLTYLAELATFTATTSDGAGNASGQTITVTDGATVRYQGVVGTGVSLLFRYGNSYRVSGGNNLPLYTAPGEQTFTANSTTRAVSVVYQRIPYTRIVFDKTVSDPANITGAGEGAIVDILAKMRRCLVKKTANGEVAIAYLDNADSNRYADGSAAVLTGNEGDVMVYKPAFYYKYQSINSNSFAYDISEQNLDGTYILSPASLIGAYKATNVSNKLYSRSGGLPTGSITQPNFMAYAKARGTGYNIIDFEQHCMIALLFYAKYGTRNSQAILGVGGANYDSTNNGTTNSLGNTDTVAATTGHASFAGIEGVHGCMYEWVGDVTINNGVWTVTNPDGTTRNGNAPAATSGSWVQEIAASVGPYFDVIPTAAAGSDSTYYADNYSYNTGARVFARSFSGTVTGGGVSYTHANSASSNSYASIGSRLAFRGVIREAESVSAFKALPVL